MGLFDHLFKPKPDPAGEKSGDAAATTSDIGATPGQTDEPAPDPSSFLHPKGYSAGLNAPGAPVSPPASRPPEKKPPVAPASTEPPREIVLTLGDVLPRIPPHYLRPEPYDLRRELRFDTETLSSDIARGRASVPLSTIATLCPDIFQLPADELDDMEIRLPLQKLVEQIGGLRGEVRPHAKLIEAHAAPAPPVILKPMESPLPDAAVAPAASTPGPQILRPGSSPASDVSSSSPVEEANIPESPQPPPTAQIHLRLAALLPGVPGEMLAAEMPTIDESVRIALPLGFIESQLPSGKVEVTAAEFIAALPSVLRAHFVARDAARVAVPLEEIFQSLPTLRPSAPAVAPSSVEGPEPSPPAEALTGAGELASGEPPKTTEAVTLESTGAEIRREPPLGPAPGDPETAAPEASTSDTPVVESKSAVEEIPSLDPSASGSEPAAVPLAENLSAGPSAPVWLPPVRLFAPPPPLVGAPEHSVSLTPPPPMESSPLEERLQSSPPPPAVQTVERTPAPVDAFSTATPSNPLPSSQTAPVPEEPVTEASQEQSEPASTAANPTLTVRPLNLPPPMLFGHPPSPIIAAVIEEPAPSAASETTVASEKSPPPEAASISPATEAAPLAQLEPPADSTPPQQLPPEIHPRVHEKREEKPRAKGNGKSGKRNAEAPKETAPAPAPSPPIETPSRAVAAQEPGTAFDQENLQALFMTEEPLDLPRISKLAATLPGVQACVIATREQAVTGGVLPEGFDIAALLGLAPRVGEAAGRLPIGALKHFTLYGEHYSVSFFERHGLCLCAVHRARSFVPGVREKLVALADELAG